MVATTVVVEAAVVVGPGVVVDEGDDEGDVPVDVLGEDDVPGLEEVLAIVVSETLAVPGIELVEEASLFFAVVVAGANVVELVAAVFTSSTYCALLRLRSSAGGRFADCASCFNTSGTLGATEFVA